MPRSFPSVLGVRRTGHEPGRTRLASLFVWRCGFLAFVCLFIYVFVHSYMYASYFSFRHAYTHAFIHVVSSYTHTLMHPYTHAFIHECVGHPRGFSPPCGGPRLGASAPLYALMRIRARPRQPISWRFRRPFPLLGFELDTCV